MLMYIFRKLDHIKDEILKLKGVVADNNKKQNEAISGIKDVCQVIMESIEKITPNDKVIPIPKSLQVITIVNKIRFLYHFKKKDLAGLV